MTKLKIKLILAGFFCFFAAVQTVYACSCYPLPAIYETFQNSSAVFTGKVLSFRDQKGKTLVREEDGEEIIQFTDRIFRFQVIDKFKGVKNTEVEVNVGPVNSSCYSGFTVGESYLIYADQDGKILSHSFCSRREALVSADTQIYFIKEFLRGVKEPQIYGSVSRLDTFPNTVNPRNTTLEKVKVWLEGKTTIETLTDKNGIFKFNNIPDGDYKLKTVPAKEYINFFSNGYDVKVENGKVGYNDGGIRFSEFKNAVFADFTFGWNNEVNVKVFDINGKRVKNAAVRLLPANLPFGKIVKDDIYDRDDDGEFRCSNETPGKYYLTAEIFVPFGQNDRIRIFYPQAETTEKATLIDLKAPDNLSFDLLLPAKYLTREIKGQVIWSDGQPADLAIVLLQKSEIFEDTKVGDESLYYGFDWERTDKEGNFVLQAFEGGEYWLHFEDYIKVVVNGETKDVRVQGKPVKIKVGKTNEPLKIILKKP